MLVVHVLCGTRFYNNAAKIFGARDVLRRRIGGICEGVGRYRKREALIIKTSRKDVFLLNYFTLAPKITPKVPVSGALLQWQEWLFWALSVCASHVVAGCWSR